MTEPEHTWRYAGARTTGKAHLRSGLSCQDKFAYGSAACDVYVAAVADGAGSASMSELGAQTAVNSIVRFVSTATLTDGTDFGQILRHAAKAARRDVFGIARHMGAEGRDLASTLLVVLMGRAGGAALQIGDGVIVVGDGAHGWSWVFWPQQGEYANTTYFLTDENAEMLLEVDTLGPEVCDVALMTDGLQPLALNYASRVAHSAFFDGIFAPLVAADDDAKGHLVSRRLEVFLGSDRVTARVDDDIAIVMATRRPFAPPC